MFKKPEQIKPLPSGMADAFSKTLERQGFKAPEPVQVQPTVVVAEQPQVVSEAAPAMNRIADKKEAPEKAKMVKMKDKVEAVESESCECGDDAEYDSKGMCESCGKPHAEGYSEAIDPVNTKALKKDFTDRKDKDIDNDGDTDSSDEYLHKRRKAISKALAKESVEIGEATDFRAGDMVYQVGSKLKGTVLHKGNRDLIAVKFGSVNQMIPASKLRLAEEVELDEAKNYEYKDGKVYISKSNFRKVHNDYKNPTKGKESMVVLDPKTQGTVLAPVVFTEESSELNEVSKEGTIRIIDLGNRKQDPIRKELGVDGLPNKGFQVQSMTKGKFVNLGKPYKDLKGAEEFKRTGQHSMQFEGLEESRESHFEIVQDGGKVEVSDIQEAPAYALYHNTFSGAVQEAIAVAKKQGFEIDEDDWSNKVATGPKKPSKDKTNSYTIDLMKGGKPAKKKLHMQVYNMGPKYELNCYVQ